MASWRVISAGAIITAGAAITAYYVMRKNKSRYMLRTRKGNEHLVGLTLKHVQIFFRHGARLPLHVIPGIDEISYPTEILNDVPHTVFPHRVADLLNGGPRPFSPVEASYSGRKLKGGCSTGQLTSLGQEQAYQFGETLRREYIETGLLLTPQYTESNVFCRSTNINRSIESLRCVLAGLYGQKELTKHGKAVLHVSESSREVLYPNFHNCPCLKVVRDRAGHHFLDFPAAMADRLHIQQYIGFDSSDDNKLNFIFARDDIIARVSHGFPVPQKICDVRETIERQAVQMEKVVNCGPDDFHGRKEILQMGCGPMFDLVLCTMRNAISAQSSPALHLYSCHDSSLILLLVAMEIFDDKWPPFVADIRFELYEDESGGFWVKVMYCDQDMYIRGSDQCLLSLGEFETAISDIVLSRGSDWEALCRAPMEFWEAPSALTADS